MLAGHRCQRIYTYFKNDFILTASIDDNIKSMLEFKQRLLTLNHHYVTQYRNTEDLQWQFSRQLEMLYGGDEASFDIGENTPQGKIDEVALVLGYRQLHAGSALKEADVGATAFSHPAGGQSGAQRHIQSGLRGAAAEIGYGQTPDGTYDSGV